VRNHDALLGRDQSGLAESRDGRTIGIEAGLGHYARDDIGIRESVQDIAIDEHMAADRIIGVVESALVRHDMKVGCLRERALAA
jgi:hypothetical protein